MHWLTILGLLFNSALITANRFWRRLPDWLYLGGLVLGVAAIIAGVLIARG